jgi:alpha-ketoglutarate-dependent taurine dioxygenase
MYENSIFDMQYDDILRNIDRLIEVFRNNGLVIFRQLHASEEQQYSVLTLFGDALGWNPNSINGNLIKHWVRYDENHSVSIDLRQKFGPHPLDENILIHWHLEHIENDVPQVGAAWNMIKNNNPNPDAGSTGFVSCYADRLLPSIEHLNFLRSTTIMCTENTGWEMGWDSAVRQSVISHQITGKEVLRLCPLGHTQTVISVDGKPPTPDDQKLMNEITWWFLRTVWGNADVQFWWNWSAGDMIIPDLTVMAHAVKNGFKHNERRFIGYWAFGDGYEKRMLGQLRT